MTASFIVRPATTAADIDEVKRLVHAHANARVGVPGVESIHADAERMPGVYIAPRGGLWVAASGPAVIGCVALRPFDENAAEVKRMFVDAEWRGRGVGRVLMKAVIDGARERGYHALRLGTLHDMIAAQELYKSLGFMPIARYRPNELTDTLFFELPLGE